MEKKPHHQPYLSNLIFLSISYRGPFILLLNPAYWFLAMDTYFSLLRVGIHGYRPTTTMLIATSLS